MICGGATVVWGGVLMVFLPNSILSSKRFSVEEKILLIGRGKQNQTVCFITSTEGKAKIDKLGYIEPLD